MNWVAISYNCQSLLSGTRLGVIQRTLQADFLGLQGTKLAAQRAVSVSGEPGGIYRALINGGNVGGFFTWHWTKPRGAQPNDPRGVSVCLRARRGINAHTLHTRAEEPAEPELQGRVGLIHWRARGVLDVACAIVYLPHAVPDITDICIRQV